jgi:hypothetical protein
MLVEISIFLRIRFIWMIELKESRNIWFLEFIALHKIMESLGVFNFVNTVLVGEKVWLFFSPFFSFWW